MPNGDYGPHEEWDRLEEPLCRADPVIAAFSQRRELSISRNYHNWPERTLSWGDNPTTLVQKATRSPDGRPNA